jgi:hypothetical protein
MIVLLAPINTSMGNPTVPQVEPYQILWQSDIPGQGTEVVCADMNGDGIDDIVGATYGPKVFAIDSYGKYLWTFDVQGGGEVLDVGDLDCDGKNDVVASSRKYLDSRIYAIGNDGNLLWWFRTSDEGYTGPGTHDIEIVDINKDNLNEVIIATTGTGLAAPGYIMVLDNTGSVLWRYNLTPGAPPYYGWTGAYSVVICNIDSDDMYEIVTASVNHHVYAFDTDGCLLWSYEMDGEGIWRIAAGDIDGDGIDEVVSGSDRSAIYALRGDGSLLWSYPVIPSGDGIIAIGDIDGDRLNDVVVGSYDGYVNVINGEGQLIWRYLVDYEMETVVLGDIDSDGEPEILAAPGSFTSFIIALENDGTLLWRFDSVGWPYGLTVGDIDNDGVSDIIVSTFGGILYVLKHTITIEDIIEQIEEMDIPDGIKNSLLSKLKNALRLLEKGQEKAAMNLLEALIKEVNALRGKKLTNEDADALIAAAQSIINNMSR